MHNSNIVSFYLISTSLFTKKGIKSRGRHIKSFVYILRDHKEENSSSKAFREINYKI